MDEKRNVLIESARYELCLYVIYRIARSNVIDMDTIDISKYDVVLLILCNIGFGITWWFWCGKESFKLWIGRTQDGSN